MEPTVEGGVGAGSGVRPVAGPVVQIDEKRIQAHLDEVVRATVEETLNALLDAEATRGTSSAMGCSEGGCFAVASVAGDATRIRSA